MCDQNEQRGASGSYVGDSKARFGSRSLLGKKFLDWRRVLGCFRAFSPSVAGHCSLWTGLGSPILVAVEITTTGPGLRWCWGSLLLSMHGPCRNVGRLADITWRLAAAARHGSTPRCALAATYSRNPRTMSRPIWRKSTDESVEVYARTADTRAKFIACARAPNLRAVLAQLAPKLLKFHS
jgi:hypothetical protein